MLPVIQLNYPLDNEKMLAIAEEVRKDSKPYTDYRIDGQMDFWLIGHYSNEYIQKVMDDLEVKGKPRFYFLAANSFLPEHVDNGTSCAINFILTPDPAPVSFGTDNYVYQQALLNTQKPHHVNNDAGERILFKISIFDESFEDLAKRIKYKTKS